MSINALYTTQAAVTGQTGALGSTALGGDLQLQGLNFLDFILARLAELNSENPASAVVDDSNKQLLQSDNPLLDKVPRLDLARLIADNPEIAKEIEVLSPDRQAALTETLVLNQQAFDEILKSIKDGAVVVKNINAETEANTDFPKILETVFIDGESLKDHEKFQNKLALILDKIQALMTQEGPAPALIAINLTPEKITALQQRLADILNAQTKTDNTTAEQPGAGIVIGLLQILPLQTRPGSLGTAPVSPAGHPYGNDGMTLTVLPSKLNALAAAETPVIESTPETEDGNGFEKILKQLAGSATTKTDLNKIANKGAPQIKPDLSSLQNWKFTPEGSVFTDKLWGLDLGLMSSVPPSVTSLTGLIQPVTQAQHASLPHPAVQMVAAAIQKSLGADGNKTIALQLDPPELGKVEVSMNFGKDKTVKIAVISEKPETFLMLQRDAHVLERILENAGLSLDGGMSFELAGRDHDFNHNGRHDSGSHAQGNDDADITIVETTMTWHVDPLTGHMRYTLLV